MSRTNLKTWISDPQWVYCLDTPFISGGVGQVLTITGGAGWTPGDYPLTSSGGGPYVGPFNTSTADGFQNMIRLASAPAAAGVAGGAGDFQGTVTIGFIGDSITATGGPQGAFTPLAVLSRAVATINSGVSGTTSAYWAANIAATVSSYVSAGVTNALIMLGTNDSKTAVRTSVVNYTANITTIANALVAAGITPWLNCPVYNLGTAEWDATSQTLLQQYGAALEDVANGTTIRLGDTYAYEYFATHQNLLSDGTHPNSTGQTALGQLWAVAWLQPAPTAVEAPYTAAGNVRYGTDRGDGTTGTLRVPTAAQVLSGVLVDATTGNVALPSASNVRSGTAYGPASGTTGTAHIPTAAQVLAAIAVDATTGTVVLPSASYVLTGTTYGASSAITGTLGMATAEEIADAVLAATAGNGTVEDALSRLNVPTSTYVRPVPTPPNDPALTLVDGYAIGFDGARRPGVAVTIALEDSYSPVAISGSLLAQWEVTVAADSDGYVSALVPRGKRYVVRARDLRLNGKTFTTSGATFDLLTLA